MDYSFISDNIRLYVEAAKLTLGLGLIGILGAILAGLICSLVLYYHTPLLSPIVRTYIELSRNTPLLVQLFFLYFGLPKLGIVLSAELCAFIGLTFLGGSYMAEAFRSGLEAIDKGQTEAGLSIGFSHAQVMRYIIFPQALTLCIPSLCANMVFLIKETSVFSVLALADLMYVAKDLIGIHYKTLEILFMLVIAYAIILIPLVIIAGLLERRLRYAGFGN